MGLSTERIMFKYMGRQHKIFIPYADEYHDKIIQRVFERSYQNIGYEPYQ